MGWWNAPENSELTVGDSVLDAVRHFLKEFSKEYQEDLSRKPTMQELEYALNLAFRVNLDDAILADFDELEVKQVTIKTAKRPKRQKVTPGDIFSFKLDDGRYCFGRVVSDVSIGVVAEIFDYFAEQPIFDYSMLGKWLIPPTTLDSFTLLENGKQGEWRIIGHTQDYVPGEEFKSIRFVYGNPNDMKAVDIYNNKTPISSQEAKKFPSYSPLNDTHVKQLIANKIPPKKSRK
jgi:hypothetical protein